ncbi:hypothetical protein QCA50_015218 [Cerrena zonata]|uniref:DNA2/NAM7 helicase-like C-terminal domain-containing protein n=1 Tax=Cerrena zonata TaxID=2478898 RepID=A0AAW0FKB9_9APHY
MATLTIVQDIFKKVYPSLWVIIIEERLLTTEYLDVFLETSCSTPIGLSAFYGKKCKIYCLAIATANAVLLVHLSMDRSMTSKLKRHLVLEKRILCNSGLRKVAFDVEQLATALFLDHGFRMNNTVDIHSLLPRKAARGSPAAAQECLGGQQQVNMEGVTRTFYQSLVEKSLDNKCLALRAWASCIVASLPETIGVLPTAPTIDTLSMYPLELEALAQSVRDHQRLVALKPIRVKNDIFPNAKLSNGQLRLSLVRFKTRMRKSDTQEVKVRLNNGETVRGRVARAKGKSAEVILSGVTQSGGVLSVSTLGRDGPTNLEMERTNVTLNCLQSTNPLFEQDWAAWIFLARELRDSPSTSQPSIHFPGRRLNDSQMLAMTRILSNASSDRVCIIQGPAGTGKTTVIAATVHSFFHNPPLGLGKYIWLVAQSNVAVKNMAEKLVEDSFFDFKLLVSVDFHFEWHEHLYSRIDENVIRSDRFSNPLELERRLAGSRVILCTLSMLSRPLLATSGIFQSFPLNTVILDEASQIEIGNYLPLLSRHGTSLRKLVFIGDDKQLPPFGQDNLGNLRSVFEMSHLRTNVFLDIQYRMPKPVGNFLSQHVYDKRLRSVHTESALECCRLVDIHNGQEREWGRTSWVNFEEVNAVTCIARKYEYEGKSYRIITPYDAQRHAIEKSLKDSGLKWEDKCFNVDSFQGNEDDHIVISVVRTDRVGFLQNERRLNVMLSRCKRSMIICTNMYFIQERASKTLLGKLAREWMAAGQKWLSWDDLREGRF